MILFQEYKHFRRIDALHQYFLVLVMYYFERHSLGKFFAFDGCETCLLLSETSQKHQLEFHLNALKDCTAIKNLYIKTYFLALNQTAYHPVICAYMVLIWNSMCVRILVLYCDFV